jgi:hypothetical protein
MPHQIFRYLRQTRLALMPSAFLLMSASIGYHVQTAAQEQELAQIYSDGVHAFFRCDASTAKQFLDNAITHGSEDPRVYYFRALAQHAMGDTFAFEEDVRMAAELEVRGSGTFDIGKALERIQGGTRLELERIRREVHLTLAKQRPTQRAPSSGTDSGQPSVVPDFGRQLPANETDPFKDDEEPAMEEVAPDAEEEPTLDDAVTEEPDATDDALEAESPSDEGEAETEDMDAFGEDDAEPAEQPDAGVDSEPAEGEVPEEAGNPFETEGEPGLDAGTPEDATIDDLPAGDAPGDEAPASETPAGETPAGEGADPAAGPPAADGAGAEPEDVFSEDNPFGG